MKIGKVIKTFKVQLKRMKRANFKKNVEYAHYIEKWLN